MIENKQQINITLYGNNIEINNVIIDLIKQLDINIEINIDNSSNNIDKLLNLVITGPTNSGKSRLTYYFLTELRKLNHNVILLEDTDFGHEELFEEFMSKNINSVLPILKDKIDIIFSNNITEEYMISNMLKPEIEECHDKFLIFISNISINSKINNTNNSTEGITEEILISNAIHKIQIIKETNFKKRLIVKYKDNKEIIIDGDDNIIKFIDELKQKPY